MRIADAQIGQRVIWHAPYWRYRLSRSQYRAVVVGKDEISIIIQSGDIVSRGKPLRFGVHPEELEPDPDPPCLIV